MSPVQVLPLCKEAGLRVTFPTPYDSAHPNLPVALRNRGASLATKRLMVMDACDGCSLSKIGHRLLTDYAKRLGQTAEEYESEMKRRMLEVRCVVCGVGHVMRFVVMGLGPLVWRGPWGVWGVGCRNACGAVCGV